MWLIKCLHDLYSIICISSMLHGRIFLHVDITVLTWPVCWGGEFSVWIYKAAPCFGPH
jgi:hypothetical protein